MVRRRLRPRGRWAWISLALALFAVGGSLLAAWGSALGWWHWTTGLGLLPWMFALALVAIATGLFSRFARRDGQVVAVTAVLIAAATAGFLANEERRIAAAPAIHDISTNLDDPPAFRTLAIRSDLLSGVPMVDRPGYQALSPRDRWKAAHFEAYAGLRTIDFEGDRTAAVRAAVASARRLGWTIIAIDESGGRVEATTRSRYFGLADDLALRVRPAASGKGTSVDLRSVAREGISDHGRGARHLRAWSREIVRR